MSVSKGSGKAENPQHRLGISILLSSPTSAATTEDSSTRKYDDCQVYRVHIMIFLTLPAKESIQFYQYCRLKTVLVTALCVILETYAEQKTETHLDAKHSRITYCWCKSGVTGGKKRYRGETPEVHRSPTIRRKFQCLRRCHAASTPQRHG